MAPISKVRITAPADFHAEVVKTMEDSGCYLGLDDYVRSKMRTFVKLCELVFTPLRDSDMALAGADMLLTDYMKQLRTKAMEKHSRFIGPKKTVSVSIPKPLYERFKTVGSNTRTFDHASIGIRMILLSDIESLYSDNIMSLDELMGKRQSIRRAAADYKRRMTASDIRDILSLCGEKLMTKGKELSDAVSDQDLTINGLQILSSDYEP